MSRCRQPVCGRAGGHKLAGRRPGAAAPSPRRSVGNAGWLDSRNIPPRDGLKAPTNNRKSFTAPVSANNRFAEISAEGEGVGQPGDAQLEGVQSPQLSIQKLAPKEVQVGKPATFRVTVRNTGTIPACEVEVCDQVPRGARLVATMPQARRGVRGELVWTLGTIRPGEESKIEMQVMPVAEGEIGSVATVHFGADASARSIVTRPQLVVDTKAPNKVMIGDQRDDVDYGFEPRHGRGHGRGAAGANSARIAASGRNRVGVSSGRSEAGRKP